MKEASAAIGKPWRERPRIRRWIAILAYGILLAATYWQITETRLRIATGLILLLFLWLTLRRTPSEAPEIWARKADMQNAEEREAADSGNRAGGPM